MLGRLLHSPTFSALLALYGVQAANYPFPLFRADVNTSMNPLILGFFLSATDLAVWAGAEKLIRSLLRLFEPVNRLFFSRFSFLNQTDSESMFALARKMRFSMVLSAFLGALAVYLLFPFPCRAPQPGFDSPFDSSFGGVRDGLGLVLLEIILVICLLVICVLKVSFRRGSTMSKELTFDREIRFGLAIATRNRPEALASFLKSLYALDSDLIRFIVVMDQSEDAFFSENVKTVKAFDRWPIHHIRQEARGLSKARNEALRKAFSLELLPDGEDLILGFPDDDCRYYPDTLSKVVESIRKNPGYHIWAGAYGDESGLHPKFPSRAQDIDFWNVFHISSSIVLFFRMSILKDIFFDEGLGVGTLLPAGEEVDLVLRLMHRGYKGFYDPSIRIYHKVHRIVKNSQERLARERANAFVLARATRHTFAFPLGVRLGGRLFIDMFRLLVDPRPLSKRVALERIKGVRQGWSAPWFS